MYSHSLVPVIDLWISGRDIIKIFFMYYDDTYELVRKYSKVWIYIEVVINVFFYYSRKIFKAYYGFRVLYVFPFPSAGHGPIGSGRDKVGIRAMVSLLILELSFCVFIHYCGNRLSNVGSVIITFSILHCVCFIVVFWFCLPCLLRMRGEHEMLPLLKQLMILSSPFMMKLLLLLLDVEEEIVVVEECCIRLYLFRRDFRNGFVGLILCYPVC